MKRVLAAVLLLALTLSCSVVFAEVPQPRASELIVDRFIYAYAYGDGEIEFAMDMTTLMTVEKLGFPSIKIQEKRGSSWTTVKTVTDKYGYNRINYSYSGPYSGTAGNQYRVIVEYYAKDGDISDTKPKTSSALTAK